MPPALSEAVGALRVLGDPASAWGTNKAEGMRMFARGARERVVQIHRGEPDETADPLAGPFTSLPAAELAAGVWAARGVRVLLEQVGSRWFLRERQDQPMCATCGEEPAGHSGRCSRCDRNILEDRERAA